MRLKKTDIDTPLCVDLDGTLINTDMMWECLIRLFRRNPFAVFQVLAWWTHGRAYLKAQLAARVQVDAATLPYNKPLIGYLNGEKKKGRKVLLVTASDLAMVSEVPKQVPALEEVLASDGVRNLRGKNKGATLAQIFGEKGFDYAGNSHVDLPVWERAREAIVVNGGPGLKERAAKLTDLGPVFPREQNSLPGILEVLAIRRWWENIVAAIPIAALEGQGRSVPVARGAMLLAALCLCSSGASVMSHLFRLDYDRFDPSRRSRPFAAGTIPIQAGPALFPALILTGLALALPLGLWVESSLIGLILSGLMRESYSTSLRVLGLLGMFTARLIGGWLLAGF